MEPVWRHAGLCVARGELCALHQVFEQCWLDGPHPLEPHDFECPICLAMEKAERVAAARAQFEGVTA